MKVGVFTPLLSSLPLDAVLKKLTALGIDTVEFATGNYPGDAHCKLSMLDNPSELATFKGKIADAGFTISALSCHGNPLHPNKEEAQRHREVSRKTILLAEKLGDPTAGSQLCLPFTLGSAETVAMARDIGSTALYWGVSDTRRINRPGDDPFTLVRLKNDFILRLPGPQRRSLPAIYLDKTVRRLRGTKP